MKKRILILSIILIVILVSTGLITSYADSARVRNGMAPKHTIKIISEDGNKVTYWGLGYKVVLYPSSIIFSLFSCGMLKSKSKVSFVLMTMKSYLS